MKMGKLKFVLKELRRMADVSKGSTAVVFLGNAGAAAVALLYTGALNRLFSAVEKGQWGGAAAGAFFLLAGMALLQDILNGVTNYLMSRQKVKVQKGYMASFFEKADRLGAAQMQDPKVLDILESIRKGREACMEFLVHAELLVSYYFFYLAFMIIYLCRIHWLLAAAMGAAYIPSVLSYRIKGRLSLRNEKAMAGLRRQRDAYCSYVTGHKFLKESRFWGVERLFAARFGEADRAYQKERMWGFRRQNGVSLFTNFMYVLGYGVVLAAVLYLVRQQTVSVAEAATVLAVVLSVYDQMDELMNYHIAGMAQNLNGLLNMHRLMEITIPDGREDLEGDGYEAVLSGVSFAYPGAAECAVKDVSLEVRNGELLAVVGENGSGKTTLSKILCGLYQPTGGSIKINGRESREICRRKLMKEVSAVFQNFNRYPLTVGENIRIADPGQDLQEEAAGGGPGQDGTAGEKLTQGGTARGKLIRAVEFAGLGGRIASEEKGFDTLLSREFGGVDWSGGLWQRLAIARAFYRESRFFVFDEPTAAIDPLEELDVMGKMAEYARGRTAILVTHRIGAARLADRIIVMAHGRICEAGTHKELLERGGEYARMYEAQRQWYQ